MSSRDDEREPLSCPVAMHGLESARQQVQVAMLADQQAAGR